MTQNAWLDHGLCPPPSAKDLHYGAGIHRCENMYEVGGFIVHFFGMRQVDQLAIGCELLSLDEFEEGDLPRKLFRVTLRRR